MSPFIINFVEESCFFYENFFPKQSCFLTLNYDFFFFINDFSIYNFLQITNNSNLYTKSLITFIDQTEDANLYNNLENINSIYHYSIPNTKLAYPEPFVASPSFMHTDLWFIHILVYQYWLWFVFVFIVVFFMITFICTIRWCNMRVRPRRETRGVSRSKCGDLVTACVPVTWATSIIVNESTDAIDYYDGFGTTELVVGIRAYQWGWEYYYPKDIDLNYNIKPNYSTFIGNSLKYNKTSDVTLSANNLWKFYQNKTSDHVITPAHLLVLPIDNYKLLNLYNFNDIGASPAQELSAFKKVRMFSKIFTSNLVFNINTFSNKYKNFSQLYLNETLFTDSYAYGLKRQHNFLAINALLNNNTTFLNLASVNKIINFNFKTQFVNYINLDRNSFFNFFNKFPGVNSQNFVLRNSAILDNSYLTKRMFSLNSILSVVAFNDDKKEKTFFLFDLFNTKFNKNYFWNFFNVNALKQDLNTSLFFNNFELESFFFNYNSNYQISTTIPFDQSEGITFKYFKNFMQVPTYLTNYNLLPYSSFFNTNLLYLKHNALLTNFFFSNLINIKWKNITEIDQLLSLKLNFNDLRAPIVSNHSATKIINNKNFHKMSPENALAILREKKEIPEFLTTTFYNFYKNNSPIDWKLYNIQNFYSSHNLFYFPTFNFYYDYDLRNWQSTELIEDTFWESIYSIYNHEEYLNLTNDFYEYETLDKINKIFNSWNKFAKFKNRIIRDAFFKDTISAGDFIAGHFYLDDFINTVCLLPTKDLFIFPIFSTFNNVEESYDTLKYLNYEFNFYNKNFFNFYNKNFSAYAHSFAFDIFRSTYEDFSWFSDELNNLNMRFHERTAASIYQCFDYWKLLTNEGTSALFNDNFLSFIMFPLNDVERNFFNFEKSITAAKTSRFSNNLNLRSPVKNSIVNYNAMQKVFRARFDEGRSNTHLTDLNHSYSKQPMISSSRMQYEKILGKNKENFIKINFYKNNFQSFFNNLYEINTNLNFYFYDFPFLLALKSDASRYLWFDWFAKWGFYEVQPSSSSRYAIYGMPYLSKIFEFNETDNRSLNESETYLLRIARARKNYLPNWTYIPYFFAKHTTWYKNNLLYEIIDQSENLLIDTQFTLSLMNWYWTNLSFISFANYQFFPSNSGNTSYTKLGWKPQNSIQAYYYSISTLVDILTKREYLYRELFSINNKITNLPFYLTTDPSNPLINDVKASFLFVDPINWNNEYSRNIYFNSLNFFNSIILKSFLYSCSNYINLSFLTDYLFYYLFNINSNNSLQNNLELYKNQYRPMRKGITNMIRLHATGAVAMPIEIRLQILASSKDVIHSWAIPSAGIKIDCVPGYSSHKVIIFLVSGIFWGQCMEVCGRYHHWMPIVVYFMKRDLFFLWCTHFAFVSNTNNTWNVNDRQFNDYIRLISFDKYSWLSEINN